VTQGRTEHLVTIIDKRVLQLLQDGKQNSQSENAGWRLEQLDQQSKIQIQWNNTGAKQPVVVSSVKLRPLKKRSKSDNSSKSSNKRHRTNDNATSVASALASTPAPAPAPASTRLATKEEQRIQEEAAAAAAAAAEEARLVRVAEPKEAARLVAEEQQRKIVAKEEAQEKEEKSTANNNKRKGGSYVKEDKEKKDDETEFPEEEEEDDDDDDDNDGKNDVEEKENNTEEEGVAAVTVANMAAATSNHHRTRPDAAGTVIDTAIPAAAADGSVAVNPNSLRRSERKKKNSSNSTNNNVNNTATSNHHCTRSVAVAATTAAGEAVAVAPTSDEEERPVEEQERANQQEGVEAEAATRDIQQKLSDDKRSDMMDRAQDNMEEGLHGGQLVARMRLGLKMDSDYITNTLIPKCMNKKDLDDYTPRNKRTAFMVAVRSGDKELIKVIWERYQSICNGGELRDVLTIKLNYSSSFWNVFMNACKCGNNDCIKLIHGYYIEPAMSDVRRVEIINRALARTLDFCQIDSKAKPYVLLLLGIDDVKFIGNYPADYGQRRSSARSSH